MIFDEIVTISDSAGTTFHLTISTPTKVRLGLELLRNGGFTTWRPHIWGGDWEVEDAGQISCSKGKVWYRRSGGDFQNGLSQVSDIRHLDILLWPDDGGGDGEDDWGIGLRSFFTMDGLTSGGGSGYLDPSWVLKATPGAISWGVPSRAVAA